jgi:hypothetical protein
MVQILLDLVLQLLVVVLLVVLVVLVAEALELAELMTLVLLVLLVKETVVDITTQIQEQIAVAVEVEEVLAHKETQLHRLVADMVAVLEALD